MRSISGTARAALAGLALIGLALWSLPAAAQTYPDHVVKIVVPNAPGGGFDIFGRLVAERLAPLLVQTVIVENKPGAGTLVGTDAVAKAAPDGYTLLVGGLANIVLNVGLYPKLPYDPLKDLTSVGILVSNTYALVTRKDLPYADAKALVAFASANPDKVTYASGGRGTGQHIAMAVTGQLAGVKLLHVPYRGAQPAYQDILGGRIDLFFDNVSTALPLIDDDRVKVLAVSSAVRHPRLPSIPTIAETGVADFALDNWFGIFAPSATPLPILERLRAEIAKIAVDPSFTETFTKTGNTPLNLTNAQAEALIARDMARWTKLIKDAGITAE